MAALVRGMQVEDALLQLQLTVKRAAKTVYQVICEQLVSKEKEGVLVLSSQMFLYIVQVIHSARANAVHNHGLDSDRLLVGKQFVLM